MSAAAYNQGWHDGYQAAHDQMQEHEARIYAVAFASGLRAGNHAANQSITKPGWAENYA